MFVGINWTSSHTTKIVSQMAKDIKIDFCEILIDNFLLYDPEIIKEVLPTEKCAFHIMHSHFLHRSRDELEDYAQRIKNIATVLKPIYISDHIGVFEHNKRRFPIMQEVFYEDFFELFKQKSYLWSNLLENIVYYENYPSFEPQSIGQIEFFSYIQNELKEHANILFDISNAIIAEKNGAEKAASWKEITLNTNHFHVAGYEKASNLNYYLDSHNKSISQETVKLMNDFYHIIENENCTLTIERDSNLNALDWQDDIKMIRGLNDVVFTSSV